MNPDHQAAVLESARRMRDWRERHERPEPGKKGRRIYSGREKYNGGERPEPPCAPIERLREAGEIDGRKDAHLTAIAYRLSHRIDE